jgi:hypothetical protein
VVVGSRTNRWLPCKLVYIFCYKPWQIIDEKVKDQTAKETRDLTCSILPTREGKTTGVRQQELHYAESQVTTPNSGLQKDERTVSIGNPSFEYAMVIT